MNHINNIQSVANKDFGDLDQENKLLETAYFEIEDNRELEDSVNVSTSTTKNALYSLADARTLQRKDSKKLKVQFNPTSIELNASGGVANMGNGIAASKKIEEPAVKECSKIEFSVKLIFDRSIYIDSSVMPEVEGFLSILKNPYTRLIKFYWGNLYYKGKLTSVDVEYTMFNAFGIPVRGTVNVKMELLK